jgi:hypothetical protein
MVHTYFLSVTVALKKKTLKNTAQNNKWKVLIFLAARTSDDI